ncbi:MAG TPA: TetR/AcrR family transcriptional regulator [Rhodothermales bacterium]|nr:TetR/AcrR family transcriptional regulator [Rhodothermales bacterium]
MMNPSTKRQRGKEQRRNRIIGAAERVFFSKGIEPATMDEIAELADISKGLLYVYFKSKEDLYDAVCFRGLRMLRQSMRRAVAQHETGMQRIRAIGYTYVTFAQRYPDYFGTIVYQAAQEVSADEDSYAAACELERDRIFSVVADAIRLGVEDHTIRDDLDPMEAAVMLWGQMHGIIQVAVLKKIQERYQLDFDALIRFSFDFVTDALKPAEVFSTT